MTAAEARALFSPAFEGELDAQTDAALQALLARDPALAEEYAAFARMLALAGTGAPMAARTDGAAATVSPDAQDVHAAHGAKEGDLDAPTPDLLPLVQRRLRAADRGRYYADRFAERRGVGGLPPWLLAGALLVLLGCLWLALAVFDRVR